MAALIAASELAKDMSSAELLLQQHQERKVSHSMTCCGMLVIFRAKLMLKRTVLKQHYSLVRT